MSGCICSNVLYVGGRERPEWPDPDCPKHGLTDRMHATPLLLGHRISETGGQPMSAAEAQRRLYDQARQR